MDVVSFQTYEPVKDLWSGSGHINIVGNSRQPGALIIHTIELVGVKGDRLRRTRLGLVIAVFKRARRPSRRIDVAWGPWQERNRGT